MGFRPVDCLAAEAIRPDGRNETPRARRGDGGGQPTSKATLSMMRYRAGLLLAALLTLAAALAACNQERETPTALSTPALATATVTAATAGTTPTGGPAATVAGRQPQVIDLASTQPLLTVFTGEPGPAPSDFGDIESDIPALAVGDFNHDGAGDLLLGARFGDGPDNGRADAGEAYVVFGSPTLGGTIDLARGEQHLTFYGARPGDNLGFAVAAADLNADGTDDIIVSAPISGGPAADFRTSRGEAYVFLGRPDLGGTMDLAEVQPDVTVTAAEGFSLMGDSIATGDVNGDGIDDLILGAPFAGRVPGAPHGGPRTYLGEVYAIFGSRSLRGRISIPQAQQNFTISGPEEQGRLGDAVAVGDVNGDGIDDIIAVVEAADRPDGRGLNAGMAYVVFGSRSLSGRRDIAKGEQDITIVGNDAQGALGFCAASSDINEDKMDDILLVARQANGAAGSRETSGEAYVILGSRDLSGTLDTRAGDQDITIFAVRSHDLLGSCSAGHDLNGDGVGDILLGTSFANGPDGGRDLAGEAYVLFGPFSGGSSLDLAMGAHDVVLFGAEAGDRFGAAVQAGDLNSDGREEIIVAASESAGPRNERARAGEVYVIAPVLADD